jgi:tetratricopeptide (TPR) repeat protein
MKMRVMTTMTLAGLLGLSAGGALCQGPAASAAAMTPAQAQMRSRLAKAYQFKEKGKPAEAIAAFRNVLRTDPGNSEAIMELGYLHAGLKQWPAAAKYLKQASEQDPGSMRLRMDLAYARSAMGDEAGAAEQFRAVAAEPGEFQQRAREALAALGAGAEAASRASQRRIVNEGWAALRRGDRANARRKFEQALAKDPKDAGVLKQVGFLDLHDGKMEAAVRNFETARALDAGDHFIALQLGYLYDRMGDKERSREAFTAALASPDEKIHAAAETALRGTAGAAPKTEPALPAL